MDAADSAERELPAAAEWLLCDGRSGYGCGTTADLPRRRYHGLWIARAGASSRRHMVVAGLDERVEVGSEQVSTLHAWWSGMTAPMPPPIATSFALRPQPTWLFRHGAFLLERAVRLRRAVDGVEPALLLRWRNLGPAAIRLFVRPLLGWTDVDHLIAAHDGFDGTVTPRGASWGMRPDDTLPPLWLTADGVAAFRAEPDWYRGFVYEVDRDRGYDHQGDRYSPGVLELDIAAGGEILVAFALGEPCVAPASAWQEASSPAAAVAASSGMRARLAATADDFFYRAEGGRLGVLAGFPWFGEWGRDVFLALPGLTLACARNDRCAEVLSDAVPFLRRGLLPNIYAATVADSHYGSGDAALWFALAVQRYAAAGGDAERLRAEYLPALVGIADHYLEGTDLGLAVTADGLLAAGGPELNATWMDAQTGSGPVTPREGLPVEIQALWYALLQFLVEHGETRFAVHVPRCGASFVEQFWLAGPKHLADRVHAGQKDPSVRPNMLVAAALARSPLSRAQRLGVVAAAEAALVTPRGLRTLAPDDPAYRGRYGGGIEARDGAYHQGTVWPWLSGFYVEAALAAATASQRPKLAARLLAWLGGMEPELDRAGLEHISEVFDGDAPQRPGGTFAQAWNSGELLRAFAMLEDAS